jgi:hypothetical protein
MQRQYSEHPCDGVSRLRRTNDAVGSALKVAGFSATVNKLAGNIKVSTSYGLL